MKISLLTSKALVLLLIICLLFSCSRMVPETEIAQILETVRIKYAPDSRTALFNMDYMWQDKHLVLKGETSISEARDHLIAAFDSLGISLVDSIAVLPKMHDENASIALINVSVANLRAKPSHRAELTSQALLGSPLTVLKKSKGWCLVQTPDLYIAWIDQSELLLSEWPVIERFYDEEKVYFNAMYGSCFLEPLTGSPVISDLVMGCVLLKIGEEKDFFKVEYPDGRVGYVPKQDAIALTEWRERRTHPADSLLKIAKSMMGLPYLWGGTSAKSVDCSGYTKMIYLHQGLTIMRDASQQAREGALIDSIGDFDKLLAGDLLFFGRKSETGNHRIVHVGIWIGEGQFIHASGDVHIGSFDSESGLYDAYNLDRYVMARRYFEGQYAANALRKDPYQSKECFP